MSRFDNASTQLYSILYRVNGVEKRDRVVLIEGYTLFGDIPKILAITNSVDKSTIVIHSATLIEA